MVKMTIAGIGVEFAILSVVYGIAILIVNYSYFPDLTFILEYRIINIMIGSGLIISGISVIRKSLIIVKFFHEKKLCTEGMYSRIQHPIYFGWIILIIPGLVIITGLILAFSIPVFMYVIFRIFIRKEEEYLEHLFGEDYLKYKNSTNRIIPWFN